MERPDRHSHSTHRLSFFTGKPAINERHCMLQKADIATRWAEGKTYSDYRAGLKSNREMVQVMERAVALTDQEREAVATLRSPLRALVVSEDWCPDCALNIPVLMAIAEAHPPLDVRFVGREANWDLLAHAKKGERMAIPTFFFFDALLDLKGYWVERPQAVEALLNEFERGRTPPAEPDRTAPVWKEFRMVRTDYYQNELFLRRGLWRETVSELLAILRGDVISNVAALAVPA